MVNPLTLSVSLEGIVCYSHNFENKFGIKHNFTKYLKESCCLASNEHFSFKYFQENVFLSKIFPNHQASFGLSGCKWVKLDKSWGICACWGYSTLVKRGLKIKVRLAHSHRQGYFQLLWQQAKVRCDFFITKEQSFNLCVN